MKRVAWWWSLACLCTALVACGSDGEGTGDTLPPRVAATSPAVGAAEVAVSSAVTATLSEAVDPSAINTSTFTLDDGTGWRAGTVTLVGTTATFTPSAALAPDTAYTATLSTGIADLAGNRLAADFRWTFRTAPAPDTAPPIVRSTHPARDATEVDLGAVVTVTLDEPLDATSVGSGTLALSDGVTGTVTRAGKTITFTPSAPLLENRTYIATLSGSLKDRAGNALAAPYHWAFTTGPVVDLIAPTVVSTDPPDGATGATVDRGITVYFSEPIDPLSVNTATFKVPEATGTLTIRSTSATFVPLIPLDFEKTYTATLTTGVSDQAGNHLQQPYTWSFTTSRKLNTLFGIAASGASVVAVGSLGTIETSTDGASWTPRVSGSNFHLNAVATSGTRFVAVGDAGTVLTSSNLSTWTARNTPTQATLRAVTWTGSQFIAVGDAGTLLSSPDGLAWTARSSGTSQTLRGVAGYRRQHVAVGDGGTILTSPTGSAWTARTSQGGDHLNAVVWTGTQFVVGGDGGSYGQATSLQTSFDGVNWTPRSGAWGNTVVGLAWSGSTLYAVGTSGTMQSSPDGISWTAAFYGTWHGELYAVTWFKGHFLTAGAQGLIQAY